MSSKVGSRVGAILSMDGDSVRFLGYGTYVGDAVPEEATGFLAELAREAELPNPKIELDDGSVVYGCECWWGSKESVEKELEGRNIVHVAIDDVRQELNEKGT